MDFLFLDSSTVKTFEEHSLYINYLLEYTKNRYVTILKAKDQVGILLLYYVLDKDDGSVCAKTMDNVGGWRCNDCIKNSNTIFCQDCWETMKDKHKNHNISYIINVVSGTCDCGDINCIDKEYFCNKHKGPFMNDEQMHTYVKTCITENEICSLKETNRNLIKEMAKYINKAIDEGKTKYLSFTDNIINFVTFLSFYSSAKFCIYILTPLLLEKYPCKTKHTCLDLGLSEYEMKIVNSSLFSHDCKCPFIRLLMAVWPAGQKHILYKFLLNYKLRKAMGYFYMILYKDFLLNMDNDFYNFGAQIIFDEVCRKACNTDGLIECMYSCVPEVIKVYKNKYKNEPLYGDLVFSIYRDLCDITFKLRNDTVYLLKPICMQKLGSREKIYMYLIDSLALIHNLNSVREIILHIFKIADAYNSDLIRAEMYLLEVFSLYVSILHFDDKKLIKNIFSYFSDKICSKRYITLEKNEYSCHIPLIRGFSILLNRYCFYYADKNKTDIFSGLNDAIKLIPNHKEVFKIMINSLYKVFGFITACGDSFFNYYGPNMVLYEVAYYSNKDLVYRDFTLMKYLFACKDNKNYFGFNYILKLSQVEDSNLFFENNLFNSGNTTLPYNWQNEGNKIYLQFSAKILRIILNVLRNNTCLIWDLGSNYSRFINNKVEDKLVKSVIETNKNNFIELTIELIVNKIISQQNLSLYTDIYDSIYFCIIECLGKDLIKDLILTITNKTLTHDKKAKFSVKDEYLKLIDINYISSPRDQSSVEKYITDFKKNQISIFNVHFYPTNIFEIKLSQENYKQIFFCEDNFDFLFRFTTLVLKNKEYFSLQEFMLNVLLNFLSTFFYLDNDTFDFFRETINNKILELKNTLEYNNLKDEMQKSYCHYIVEKISEHDKTNIISKNEISNNDNNNKINCANNLINPTPKLEKNVPPASNKKSSMKEKMKNKFKMKNANLGNKFGLNNIKIEEKKDKEACIYCLKPIEDDDITKPYGNLGDFLHDKYLTNAFIQVIKKEYETYFKKDKNLLPFDKVYSATQEKKIRIISCNHKIHFSCYFKAYMKSDLKNSINFNNCPLCNRIFVTYIPSLNNYTKEQTFGVFLTYDVDYIMKLGIKKLDYYNDLEKKSIKDLQKFLGIVESLNKEVEEDDFQIFKNIKEEQEKISVIPNDNLLGIKITDFKNKYKDLINSCKHYIEGYLARRLELLTVDIGSAEGKLILKQILDFFSFQYKDFIDFFENTDDKKTIVDSWKNFILSLKLLIKLNIIDSGFFFAAFYKMVKRLNYFTFGMNLERLIKLDFIRLNLGEFLFLVLLFFDYNDIEGYEKFIIYYVLPVFGFEFFYREIYLQNSFKFNKDQFTKSMNEEGLYKYLNKEISEKLNTILRYIIIQLFITKILLKNEQQLNYEKLSLELNDMLDYLNLSDLKNKTFIQILDYLETLMSKETGKKIFNYLKPIKTYKEFFKKIISIHQKLIKSDKCDKILSPLLFGACLPVIFNFIKLPETAIDLQNQYYNIPCEYCQLSGKKALICLDCGKKVCDSRLCLVEEEGNCPGFVDHCVKCGGGRAAFLETRDCNVIFMFADAIFTKFIPFYVNEFGEGITKKDIIGQGFKLSEEEVKNALKMFTNYSYSNATVII